MRDEPIPTTPTYCVAGDVALERREPPYTSQEAGPELGRRPTLPQVNQLILDWEDYIDRMTRHAWRQRRVTAQLEDLKIGALKYGNRWDSAQRLFDNWWIVVLPHRALRTFVSGTNKIELWNGAQYTDLVAAGAADRNSGNWWSNDESGEIFIRRGLMMFRDLRVRITYDYGEAAVPGPIKLAAKYLVAADLEISQPGRTPEGQADKLRSASRYDIWYKRAHQIIDRFKEVAVI